jgi:hypothetical protein
VVWFENGRTAGTPSNALTFTRHTVATLNRAHGLLSENLDGDLARELVATYVNGAGGAIVLLDPPADPRNTWAQLPIDDTFGDDLSNLVAGDFNLDGRIDLAAQSDVADELRVYYHDANGGWIPQSVRTGYISASSIGAGDLDGDQRPDVAACTFNFGAADDVSWFRNVP